MSDKDVDSEYRKHFEEWLKSENVCIERFTKFPWSYVVTDANAYWSAWQAARLRYA